MQLEVYWFLYNPKVRCTRLKTAYFSCHDSSESEPSSSKREGEGWKPSCLTIPRGPNSTNTEEYKMIPFLLLKTQTEGAPVSLKSKGTQRTKAPTSAWQGEHQHRDVSAMPPSAPGHGSPAVRCVHSHSRAAQPCYSTRVSSSFKPSLLLFLCYSHPSSTSESLAMDLLICISPYKINFQ